MIIGSEQIWFDLYQTEPDVYKKKIVEELTELSLAYQHHQDRKATDEMLAEEVADVYIQLSKIVANNRKLKKLVDKQIDTKMLHIMSLIE